jgi:hypothetical protein
LAHHSVLNKAFLHITVAFWMALSATLYGQTDFHWWNTTHNWDGVSTWHSYMHFEPGRMGPNALPVPETRRGLIDSTISMVLAPDFYTAPNDFTAGMFTQISIPFKEVVSLQIWWVPVEYFNTDTIVRDYRAARTREAEGIARGDVYIGTVIQVLRDVPGWPDLALGINIKSASGGGLSDARHTNAPGYFFDLSGGKTLHLKQGHRLRLFAMGGFYVYQTNRVDYFQNDAVMWGMGGTWLSPGQWKASLDLSGYIGYIGPLDRPAVIRAELRSPVWRNMEWHARYLRGNTSFPFTGIRIGGTYHFPWAL